MKKIIYLIYVIIIAVVLITFKKPITGDATADKALKTFSNIIENNKSRKTFHMELQHFGFKLDNGYKIEWTKNTKSNKLDLVMILNADEFSDVGINVESLEKDFVYKDDNKMNSRVLIHSIDISNKNKVSYGATDGMRRILSQDFKIISYIEDGDFYSLNLENGFEIWFSDNKDNKFDIAFIVNIEELLENGLSKNNLPERWELLNDKKIIRYYKLDEV